MMAKGDCSTSISLSSKGGSGQVLDDAFNLTLGNPSLLEMQNRIWLNRTRHKGKTNSVVKLKAYHNAQIEEEVMIASEEAKLEEKVKIPAMAERMR